MKKITKLVLVVVLGSSLSACGWHHGHGHHNHWHHGSCKVKKPCETQQKAEYDHPCAVEKKPATHKPCNM